MFAPVPGAATPQSVQLTLWTDVAPGIIPTTTAKLAPSNRQSTTTLAVILGWPVLLTSFVAIFGFRKRLATTRLLSALVLFGLLAGSSMVMSGCSNGSSNSSSAGNLTPIGVYKVTVTASGPNNTKQAVTVQLTVAAGVAGQE